MSGPSQVDEAEWKRTNPLGLVVGIAGNFRKAVLPIVAVAFGSRGMESGLLITLAAVIAILIISAGASWITWRRLQYRIGSGDIKLEQGVLSRSARSVPFERIQDVSLQQELIPRLLGLVEVRFETGAGGKDELKLTYVTEAEGEALRETVRARMDGAVPALSSDQPPAETREIKPLFAMGPGRLMLMGLFEFSLIVFAVLAGAAQQLDFLLPFDMWDTRQWEAQLGPEPSGLAAKAAALGVFSQVTAIAGAILMLALVGLATGIFRTFAREYGFRLDQTPKGFRRRRGLFTRSDVVMPVHRVQALVISTGLIRRIWGWRSLSFVSLAQDAGAANHVVMPFAQNREIAPVAAAAGFVLPGQDTDWQRPSPRYRMDQALLGMVLPIIGACAAIVLDQLLIGLALGLLALLLALRAHILWRFECHTLDSQQVLSRSGWLVPKLTIAARVKLHSAEISQGPIARRRGYADLSFGLAGGSLSFRGLALENARDIRRAVLDSIAQVDFSDLPR